MTLENTHLATDIQGDNKLYAFDWTDMPDLIDRNSFHRALIRFKRRNLEVIDGLKHKLYFHNLIIRDYEPNEDESKQPAMKKALKKQFTKKFLSKNQSIKS